MRRPGSRAARGLIGAVAVALAMLTASPAHAEDSTAHELHYNLGYDVAAIAGSAAFVIASEYFSVVKPHNCRWCDRDDATDSLNGLDRWARTTFRWHNPRQAQFDSGVTAFLLEPAATTVEMVAASASDDAGRAFPVDFLIVMEAVWVSAFVNQATKLTFARERPFVHALPDEERIKTAVPSDNYVSFYSGHTSVSFALASAAGTVATLRGYRLMPLVWASLMPLAAATGYLRIAADKHYFTDVVTGAVIGSAIGVLLPVLFHGRTDQFVPNGTGTGAGPGTATTPLRSAPSAFTLSGGF